MCSRAQIYDRAAVLGQRVQALVCQLAELQELRDRVLRDRADDRGHEAAIGRSDLDGEARRKH